MVIQTSSLTAFQQPYCSLSRYECISSVRRKKWDLSSLFATLRHWFIAHQHDVVKVRSRQWSFRPKNVVFEWRMKVLFISWYQAFYNTFNESPYTRNVNRWIIDLTLLNKAMFPFFRIDWIISLLSNVKGLNFLQDLI